MASFPIWRLLLWPRKPLERTLPQPAACECKGIFAIMTPTNTLIQAYKHVFTSPSSVDKEAKATRSGNARLHGMTSVTPPSIAYIATQVYFKLVLLCTVSQHPFFRSALHCLPHRCFVDQILFLTPKGSTCLFWSYLTMSRNWKKSTIYWFGGTGMTKWIILSHYAHDSFTTFSQVFPNQRPSRHPASVKSALGIIKAKRRQLNSASANSVAASSSC